MKHSTLLGVALVVALAAPASARDYPYKPSGFRGIKTLGIYHMVEHPGLHGAAQWQLIDGPGGTFVVRPNARPAECNYTDEFVVLDAHFGGTPAEAKALSARYAIGYLYGCVPSCLWAVERKDLTSQKPRFRGYGQQIDTQKTDHLNRELLDNMGRPKPNFGGH